MQRSGRMPLQSAAAVHCGAQYWISHLLATQAQCAQPSLPSAQTSHNSGSGPLQSVAALQSPCATTGGQISTWHLSATQAQCAQRSRPSAQRSQISGSGPLHSLAFLHAVAGLAFFVLSAVAPRALTATNRPSTATAISFFMCAPFELVGRRYFMRFAKSRKARARYFAMDLAGAFKQN